MIQEILLDSAGKNSLSRSHMERIRDELRFAQGKPVLLRGAGDCFCAGLNLKEATSLDPSELEGFVLLLENFMTELYCYPGPLIAAVNGHAIAGGSVIALCADRSIAADNPAIRIGLNETALGLRFPPRVLRIVRDRLPRASHEEVLLGGQLYTPQDAARLGLVNELAKDPVGRAHEWLKLWASLPPGTYAATKRALRNPVFDGASQEWSTFQQHDLHHWISADVVAKLRERLR